MHANEYRQILKERDRRDSRRAIGLLLMLIVGIALTVGVLKLLDGGDPVMERRRATTTHTSP